MGTNFYLHSGKKQQPPCEACGRPYAPPVPLHIGKSSVGWCFALHVIPENGINDLPDWVALWSDPDVKIVDEYGCEVTAEQMMRTITERSAERFHRMPPAFYADNHAAEGPRNLLRHQVDERHCVKHGSGTWDCILGEFS